jgi:hypothetical protein
MQRPVDYPTSKSEARAATDAAIREYLQNGGQARTCKPSSRRV